ncbi:hypothetical protein ACLKA7_017242 [Drosophila subpalustris]
MKLCVSTSLSVNEFPNNICFSCHSRLNGMHDFQKLGVDSVQRFKELVSRNHQNVEPVRKQDPQAEQVAATAQQMEESEEKRKAKAKIGKIQCLMGNWYTSQ